MTSKDRARADVWRKERIADLQAQVYLHQALAQSAVDEIAELEDLSDDTLLYLYRWQTPAEQETQLRPFLDWRRTLAKLWMAGEHNLKHLFR